MRLLLACSLLTFSLHAQDLGITGGAASDQVFQRGRDNRADIKLSAIPLALVVLFLGVAACNAIGTLAASFLVLFKRGEPIIMLYSLAAAVLGGALFLPKPDIPMFFFFALPLLVVVVAGPALPPAVRFLVTISTRTPWLPSLHHVMAVLPPLQPKPTREARHLHHSPPLQRHCRQMPRPSLPDSVSVATARPASPRSMRESLS